MPHSPCALSGPCRKSLWMRDERGLFGFLTESLRAAPAPRDCFIPAEAEFVWPEVLERMDWQANTQRGSGQAEPVLVFGGRSTCLASSLKTSAAGLFFPTLITAAGNIYLGVLGSIEIEFRLNCTTPFVPLALRWDMPGSVATEAPCRPALVGWVIGSAPTGAISAPTLLWESTHIHVQ